MTKKQHAGMPPQTLNDPSGNEARQATALAALADVAAALAHSQVAMVGRSRDGVPIFNASATASARDAVARWWPSIADASPLEIDDLQRCTDKGRAQRLARAAPALRFCCLLPLHDTQGERVATLCLADTTARKLTPGQRAGLVALSALTPNDDGGAANGEDPLRDLLADIVDRETSRRWRLSGELHDGSMQWLAAARGALSQAIDSPADAVRNRHLTQSRAMVDDTIAQLRALQFELYPPLLRDFGLPEALRWLAEKVQGEYGITCEVVVPAALPALDHALGGFLYFAVRSLWIRCATRCHARRCVTNLTWSAGELELILRHDGAATPDKPLAGRRVDGLETYLRHKGGRLRVRAARGGGQVIRLGLPLQPAASDAEAGRKAQQAQQT